MCGGERLLNGNLDNPVTLNKREPICLSTKIDQGANSQCCSTFLTPCLRPPTPPQLEVLWVVKNGKQMFC